VTSPLNDTDSPVTVVVTDTSTASAGCEIDSRVWTWGDGTTSANPASPVTHTYYWYGPAANKDFSLTLAVSHLGLESTSGAQIVPVKK
jgi:PKD repeat protein